MQFIIIVTYTWIINEYITWMLSKSWIPQGITKSQRLPIKFRFRHPISLPEPLQAKGVSNIFKILIWGWPHTIGNVSLWKVIFTWHMRILWTANWTTRWVMSHHCSCLRPSTRNGKKLRRCYGNAWLEEIFIGLSWTEGGTNQDGQ